MRKAGRVLIKQIDGLRRVRRPLRDEIRFGGVARLKEDGEREFYDAATVTARITGSAVEEHIGADGQPVPPQPDPMVSWLPKVLADSSRADAVAMFSSATDWADLYRVYELVKKGLGTQADVEALIGKTMRSRFTQTANHHRHVDVSLPKDPLSFDEGERLVVQLLEELLK
ncbi:hypothetical protein BH18ACT12_BH18ACT12_08930 [soil metagenome]